MILQRIFVPAVFISLLAACSPTGHVIDTSETRGLAYWQRPYVIAGQRYDPIQDCRGYVQKGMASWYGRDFHGRKTSNGETYNMYAMTAAHKTLPLGTHVRVTNLRNGRNTVVRLNDRGPFVKNRIIDLSYAAARKIGVVGPGTAPVRIEVLDSPHNTSVTSKVTPRAAHDFTVQLAAFSDAQNAHCFAGRLDPQWGAASIQSVKMKDRTVYRVRVGRYADPESAEQARQKILSSGFPNSFVVAFE